MIRICKTQAIKRVFFFIIILPMIGIVDLRNKYIGLPDLSWISKLLDLFYMLSACMILFYMVHKAYRGKLFFEKTTFLILILYFYIFLRTLLVDYDLKKAVVNVLIMIPVIELSIQTLQDMSIFVGVLNFFNIINFISVLFLYSTEGLKYWSNATKRFWVNNYFLGYDNGFIVLILPLLCYNLILYNMNKKKRYLVYVLICILTEIMIFSACSMIALGVFLLLHFWGKNKIFKSIIYNPLTSIGGCFGAFFILVICRFILIVNKVMNFLFHKTISGARNKLWETGIERVKQKFVFGYGFGKVELVGGYNAAHQMVLEWLLQGGIVELIIYTILLFAVLSVLNKKIEYKSILIIYNGIISFLVAYIAESYSTYAYYWVFLSLFVIANKKLIIENEIMSEKVALKQFEKTNEH